MTSSLTHTLLGTDVAIGTWTLDASRTTVRIQHKTFWGLKTVKGVFTDVSGTGEITTDRRVRGSVRISAASIDTKNGKRDHHLRSADFFDVENHPHFEMTVRSLAPADADRIVLRAELSVKGVRNPLVLTGEITDLDAATVRLHLTGSVDRHRFGVTANQLGMIQGATGIDVDAVFTR